MSQHAALVWGIGVAIAVGILIVLLGVLESKEIERDRKRTDE